VLFRSIALVKKDGTLAIISFQDMVKNNLTPKTTELKNITKVENRAGDYGMNSVAIDNSGKEQNLYKYFE
jgi:hypothetical protein